MKYFDLARIYSQEVVIQESWTRGITTALVSGGDPLEYTELSEVGRDFPSLIWRWFFYGNNWGLPSPKKLGDKKTLKSTKHGWIWEKSQLYVGLFGEFHVLFGYLDSWAGLGFVGLGWLVSKVRAMWTWKFESSPMIVQFPEKEWGEKHVIHECV